MSNLVANAVARSLGRMFPGFFGNEKHDHGRDFGWPTHLTFGHFYGMYTRNGIARAAVSKIKAKTWQSHPYLLEPQKEGEVHQETRLENQIRQRFTELRLWQMLAEADARAMVGKYGAAILRFADSKPFSEPVDRVPGGLMGLVEVIPAWEEQLEISEWDTNEQSPSYGQPLMYQFNEGAVGNREQPRQFKVHPDRIVIWSEDGTVHGRSILEPGYNDLLTMEKVSGAGGEGFWKNAKSAPVLTIDREAQLQDLAVMLGVDDIADIPKEMDRAVENWNKGFDKSLLMQGIDAKALGITLPQPEEFYSIALQSFSGSVQIPLKILVGSQTGERASTEDSNEFNQTCQSRRQNETIPNIMALVRKLENAQIIPDLDWALDWDDLTESSMAEKIERADKMASVNQKMPMTAEAVFSPDEIRDVVGLEPIDYSEGEDSDPRSSLPNGDRDDD